MNLQYITDAWLKNYRKRLSCAAEINLGDCYRWSYLAYRLHGGELITVTQHIEFFEGEYVEDCSHAFLKINNKYYDSESPKGVNNWSELNYFKRASKYDCSDWFYKTTKHKSALSFRRYWRFRKRLDKADQKLFLKIKGHHAY